MSLYVCVSVHSLCANNDQTPREDPCKSKSMPQYLNLNLIPTRGGGAHCAPTPGTLPQISQGGLELRTWNILTIKMNPFSKQKLFFHRPCPPLVTIVTSKVGGCFCFFVCFGFMQKKLRRTRIFFFFCYFHEECPKWNLLWEFGSDITLDSVLVAIFSSHSFSCSNNL